MKFTGILAVGLFALSSPACAQEIILDKDVVPEGRKLAKLVFTSIDKNGDGFLDIREIETQRENIFISQDADENNSISVEEFMGWDFGYIEVAKEKGKLSSYNTALKLVHHFRDRDSNGQVTNTEHRLATMADFERADDNRDAVLSEAEFASGFSVISAIRLALKD